MPRPYWKGYLKLSLVSCAVALYNASSSSERVSFNTLNRKTGNRLKQEFNRHGEMLHVLLRYTQSLLAQMAQMAVCNRHHTLEQQLCRRLLQSLDRLHGDEMLMTQEQIANLLGVRREGVTEGARRLQHEGLIRYSRGRITVLDRLGLAGRSCECYAVTRAECDRLLPMGADAVLPQPRLVA
jgi:Mn-dependent DtxR family transcriptional regulator